jgi:hypothetical protein
MFRAGTVSLLANSAPDFSQLLGNIPFRGLIGCRENSDISAAEQQNNSGNTA